MRGLPDRARQGLSAGRRRFVVTARGAGTAHQEKGGFITDAAARRETDTGRPSGRRERVE